MVVLSFAVSQAAVGWGREVGFRPFDLVRVASAAGIGAAVPAALIALLGARMRKIGGERVIARLLFWSAPLAAVALAATMALDAADPPRWILPANLALLGLIGWRARLFWRAPAEAVPTAWIIVAAGFAFTTLHWGAPAPDSKGAMAFTLIGPPLALVVCVLGVLQVSMRRLNRPLAACAGLSLAACAMAAWLPWVLIDGYVKAKLIVVVALAFGTAHLATTAAGEARRALPRALSLGAAGAMVTMVLAAIWMALLPVPDRFGSLSRDSAVGLVWFAASTPQDADLDGHYAADAGGNDPDDNSASLTPPAILHDPHEPADRPEVDVADSAAQPLEQPVDHVIVFIVDSLRADLVNDADERARFDFLDKLDAQSTRFERAYAPSNRTRFSLGPMLTGIAPEVFASIADRPELYARTLDDHWIGHLSAKRAGADGHSALIFSTPFAWMLDGEFDVEADYRVIDPTTDERGHTSAQFVSRFEALIDGGFFDAAPTVTVGYLADPHAEHVCADGTEGGYECYVDEVQKVDRALERVYDRLEREGVLDRALVVVTADHGRAFGELSYEGHATTLADASVRVALLMRLPDAEPRRVRTPVSLTALPATAADALHVEPVAPQLNASLLGHLDDDTDAPEDPVIVDNRRGTGGLFPVHRTAFIEGDRKLTYDWHTTHHTLVDLDEELEAGSDLSRQEPKRAEKMIERLFKQREEALDLGRKSLAR